MELKKFAYMYLIHYADFNSECRQLALMSTNTFRKDTENKNAVIEIIINPVYTRFSTKSVNWH